MLVITRCWLVILGVSRLIILSIIRLVISRFVVSIWFVLLAWLVLLVWLVLLRWWIIRCIECFLYVLILEHRSHFVEIVRVRVVIIHC